MSKVLSKNFSKHFTKDDIFMQRALELARKGFGKVAPNPMVGAVAVKNGKIIAEGYHEYFGGPHAEVNALKNLSKKQLKGATLYINLEPCSHAGKTPPCTNFLISKGVKQLNVAMNDSSPKVAGSGLKQLRKSGINIKIGVLENEARTLNAAFIKNQEQSMPFVLIKLAATLDGKIGTNLGESCYITNRESRKKVHQIRSGVDAILTTSETVIQDNPHLGVRLGSNANGKNPVRIIIDSKLRTVPVAKVYRDKNVLIATTTHADLDLKRKFEKAGIKLMIYDKSQVPLKNLFKDLYQLGVYSLMVEAGGGLVTSLLQQQLADQIMLFIAPKILGEGISWIHDLGIGRLKNILQLKNVEVERFGTDVMISGKVCY